MGCWDELCLLCGVSGGGPSSLVSKYRSEQTARECASEIVAAGADKGLKDEDELLRIIEDAFEASQPTKSWSQPSWLPAGLGSDGEVTADPKGYATWRDIAIGYFDTESGEGKAPTRDRRLAPDGAHVSVRQVVDCYAADFSSVVCRVTIPSGKVVEVQRERQSRCSVVHDFSPNIVLCERCYYYLKFWLDTDSLPPPADGRTLSFSGELYEIVNSRKQLRDSTTALLPCINYDGIEATLEQWQSFYMPCRRGTKHLAQAIEAGLRGVDLIPAILRDCRVYMFMRPDMWPSPPSPKTDELWPFALLPEGRVDAEAGSRLASLPNELLLAIFRDVPVLDLLSLSATCRSLRSLITDPQVLNHALREAILYGSLRWILPVRGLLKEEERAHEALEKWLPGAHSDHAAMDADEKMGQNGQEHIGESSVGQGQNEGGGENNGEGEVEDEDLIEEDEEDEIPPEHRSTTWYYVRPIPAPPPSFPPLESLFTKQFPYLPFVRACWASDSMMNRKRLWGQVKQFEQLWRDYRLHGWEVDRFFPSEEILDQVQEDEEGCLPPCGP